MPFLDTPAKFEESSCEMQQRAGAVENSEIFEPIAIIGMGCRWPSDLSEPSKLWDFLQAKKDAYRDFPNDRINVDAFYHGKRGRPGSFYTRGGCFLNSPKSFDHTFFGINPQEASSIDPAQRKLLETIYEAIESSGTPLERISGSQTGCFVGNFNYDHQLMQYRDAEYPEAYGISGGGLSILSNRINYVFNLKGPSMTLDTACSSSMYALHWACSAIHDGDCSGAIVAGANLILTPECQIFSSVLGALSPTSRCHTFDASADGYARADGIGALYIKRLHDAITDGDPIRAVIRSTAVNANGKTGGITRPSSDGQESTIRRAYEKAALDFALTSYFECHGTGTAVGDPLEVAAIGRLFATSRSADHPLLIGSVKTNLGHSEAVSGIAGLMKVILALERGSIPPSVGVTRLNPNIDLKNGSLKVITENTPWPKRTPRIASINSFGYGGANAHAILEAADSFLSSHACHLGHGRANFPNSVLSKGDNERRHIISASQSRKETGAPNAGPVTPEQQGRDMFLLVFSAHNNLTLKANMRAIAQVSGQYDLIDLAHTLGMRRSKLSERSFAVANRHSIKNILTTAEASTGRVKGMQSPKIGFILNGQGTQWPQMGLALMRRFPSFRHSIHVLDTVLQSLDNPPNWTLAEKIQEPGQADEIHQACFAQPLSTAIQIALIELLSSWHIEAAAIVGHSSGEIAAAYGAGLLTSKEAITVAYLRGTVVAKKKKCGSMLAVGIGKDQYEEIIQGSSASVTVACYNSADNITLSGDAQDILAIKQVLDKAKVFARILHTDGNAYHSSHMREVANQYEQQIQEHCPTLSNPNRMCKTPFVSSVTGEIIQDGTLAASYWSRNLWSPVRFEQALSKLLDAYPIETLIEIGPHSALRGPIQHICRSVPHRERTQYIPTMIRNEDSVANVLNAAGLLWQKGFPLDLERLNAVEKEKGDAENSTILRFGKVIADLPHYQWQYEKTLLVENRWTREWRLRKYPRHDILGSQVPGNAVNVSVWRNRLSLKDVSWLADHKLGSTIVFPAAGYIAMALEAAAQRSEDDCIGVYGTQCYELQEVNFERPLSVPEDDHGVETFLTLCPVSSDSSKATMAYYNFTISSVSKSDGVEFSANHSSGSVKVVYTATAIGTAAGFTIDRGSPNDLSASQLYRKFASVGLNYGPTFRRLSHIRESDAIAVADLTWDSIGSGESRYLIHPSILDSALQLCILAPHLGHLGEISRAFVPSTIREVIICPENAGKVNDSAVSIAKGVTYGTRGLRSDLTISNMSGGPILHANGVVLLSSEIDNKALTRTREPFSRMVWLPDIDCLTNDTVLVVYPVVSQDDTALLPRLDHLALHHLVQFHDMYPEFFATGSDIPHLQNFLDWTQERIGLARRGFYAHAQEILNYSLTQRASMIESMTRSLTAVSSEARLSCHLYENLPVILRKEKTGIQVALEENRLSAMYQDSARLIEGTRRLGAIVSLAAQKNPKMEILEVGAGTGSATQEILNQLQGHKTQRMYKKYVFTDITPSFLKSAEDRFSNFDGISYCTFDMEERTAADGLKASFDLVTASNTIHASSNILETLRNLRKVLRNGGKLILLELTQAPLAGGLLLGTFSDFWKGQKDPHFPRHGGPFLSKQLWREVLPQAGFSGIDFLLDDYAGQSSCTVIVATAVVSPELAEHRYVSARPEYSLIVREGPSVCALALSNYAHSISISVETVSLLSSDMPRSKKLIILADFDSPLLDNISPAEWSRVQHMLKTANSVFWITNGGLLAGKEPRYALINGLARGIRTEMTHLQISILDLDQETAHPCIETCKLVFDLAKRCSHRPSDDYTIEFRQLKGVTNISRLLPDQTLNGNSQYNTHASIMDAYISFKDLANTPVQLEIDLPGVLHSLYVQEVNAPTLLHECADFVDIEIMAIGLSRDNVMGLLGRSRCYTFGDQCAGVVKTVGSRVQGVAVGDRVFAPIFDKCGNRALVRASWCQRMNVHDNFKDMANMSVAFCVAIRAMFDLARVKQGETVLVHPATSDVGLASLQLAMFCDAEVFATVNNDDDEEQFRTINPGIRADHIIKLSNRSVKDGIAELTGNKGVDVVLWSKSMEAVHDHWSCVAPLGRFVHVHRTDDLETSKLIPRIPYQNISYMAFNIESLSQEAPEEIGRLMARIKALRTQGSIVPIPHQDFHVAAAESAFGHCVANPLSCNIVLTFDDTDLNVKYRKRASKLTFDPNATYLLVGCLGGLGRIFSKWMVKRGARHLTYLSRSGCGNDDTSTFLTELQDSGVTALVVQGDVSSFEDVQRAVRSSERPVKGAVQGALVLKDRLYENLGHEEFSSLTGTRVTGTINLHNALEGQPLEFFLMWSSWTAIFGTATQSNYLATCSFMDDFARHRRRLGLPATSLDLSQILDTGTFKREPGAAARMTRNGLYGTEDYEFLKYCEAAIAVPSPTASSMVHHDPLVGAQLLAGIDAAGLKKLNAMHPLEAMPWYHDSRFSHVLQTIKNFDADNSGNAAKAASADGDGTVTDRILKKLAQLLYVPMDDIDVSKPISKYGIDSMGAAEFRNWLFTNFKLDVSLVQMLDMDTSIQSLELMVTMDH